MLWITVVYPPTVKTAEFYKAAQRNLHTHTIGILAGAEQGPVGALRRTNINSTLYI